MGDDDQSRTGTLLLGLGAIRTRTHAVGKVFIAALVSAMFYALVYLIIRGTLGFRGGMKLNLDPESRRTTVYSVFEYPTFIAAIAKSMLWYPIGQFRVSITFWSIC